LANGYYGIRTDFSSYPGTLQLVFYGGNGDVFDIVDGAVYLAEKVDGDTFIDNERVTSYVAAIGRLNLEEQMTKVISMLKEHPNPSQDHLFLLSRVRGSKIVVDNRSFLGRIASWAEVTSRELVPAAAMGQLRHLCRQLGDLFCIHGSSPDCYQARSPN